jgi:hypothetical protein
MRQHPDLDVGTVLRELVLAEQDQAAQRLPTGLLRAYQAMPEGDRALFRRLELLLDPEVEVGLGAALVDTSPDEAGASLERLAGAQLVEPSGSGRYRVRDLARERLGAEEGDQDRQAALGPGRHRRPRPSLERRPPRLPGLRPADRHGLRAVALIPWAGR